MRIRECLFCDERTPDSELDGRGICLSCTDDWDECDEDDKWDLWQMHESKKVLPDFVRLTQVKKTIGMNALAFGAILLLLFLLIYVSP